MLNRRTFLKIAAASPAFSFAAARAEEQVFAGSVTLFESVKYPPGFSHFDYVNPNAPKGGRVRQSALGTFDSLNAYSVKGDSVGISVDDTLFKRSLDEPGTSYGLIAESLWFPDDISKVVFKLRAQAKFHDGQQILPEDVVWSFEAQKAAHPNVASYYKNVAKAEQTGDLEVTFSFSENNNHELPAIVSELAILPKHWWTANGPDGKLRDLNESGLEIPLGSGPYKFRDVKPGASVTLQRVADYWGQDLPVNVGQNNFDEIAYVFFQNPTVAFEAFKGDQFDIQRESSSKQWATGYDFPAMKDGRVIKEQIPQKRVSGMQGFVLNLRKPMFQDVRVRQAFNLAFDFEWSNTNLFYGQYTRSRSFFNNSELEATDLPGPDELALLEPLRDKVPPEVFTTEYQNPTNPDAATRRKNLRQASELLAAAGWSVAQDGGKNVLKNASGEVFKAEILLENPIFERIVLPYQQQLQLLGFTINVRTIDEAQMTQRKKNFDFDIIIDSFGQSLSPGNEQRSFFGSAAADETGSRNTIGIKNPAVDALVDKIIFAKGRANLVAATRALDRVLMWNYYTVPNWYAPFERVAHWDRFGQPEKQPEYELGIPTTWWWDAERAKAIGSG
jgi:microcin C transport system substrate-binding protein